MNISSILIGHWLEILVGALIIGTGGVSIFLFYAFIVLLYHLSHKAYLLGSVMIINQVATVARLDALLRKHGVSNGELDIVVKEMRREMGEDRWNTLEKALKALS